MIITTIIAVLAFLLSCMSLGWQIWTYQTTHQEQIKGKLSISAVTLRPGVNVPALSLEIWNDGCVPVYIKSIGLNWGEEGHKIGNAITELLFKASHPIKGPLKPGEGRTYVLPAMIPNMFSKAKEQPIDKVWVSIKSQKKEVLRIHGDNLKSYLSMMVEAADKKEQNGES